MFIHALESPGLVKIGAGGPHAVRRALPAFLGAAVTTGRALLRNTTSGLDFRRPHRLTLHPAPRCPACILSQK